MEALFGYIVKVLQTNVKSLQETKQRAKTDQTKKLIGVPLSGLFVDFVVLFWVALGDLVESGPSWAALGALLA